MHAGMCLCGCVSLRLYALKRIQGQNITKLLWKQKDVSWFRVSTLKSETHTETEAVLAVVWRSCWGEGFLRTEVVQLDVDPSEYIIPLSPWRQVKSSVCSHTHECTHLGHAVLNVCHQSFFFVYNCFHKFLLYYSVVLLHTVLWCLDTHFAVQYICSMTEYVLLGSIVSAPQPSGEL